MVNLDNQRSGDLWIHAGARYEVEAVEHTGAEAVLRCRHEGSPTVIAISVGSPGEPPVLGGPSVRLDLIEALLVDAAEHDAAGRRVQAANARTAVEHLQGRATAARPEYVQVGTWLLPEAYGVDYDHFTETRMQTVSGQCVAVFARSEEVAPLPTVAEMVGSDPAFTGAQAADYVRELRD